MAVSATTNPNTARKIPLRDIEITKQIGTTNTLLAQWGWERVQTIGYEVEWQYLTKDGVWFAGTTSTIESNKIRYSTYDYPSLAIKVRFRVKPSPSHYTVNQKLNDTVEVDSEGNVSVKDAGYETYEVLRWTSQWSSWKNFNVAKLEAASVVPETPSAPEFTITNNVGNSKVTSYDENTTHIKFQMYADDKTLVHETAYIILTANVSSWSIALSTGHTYKVRAKALNNSNKNESEWSQWSSDVSTPPAAIPPGTLSAVAASAYSVKLQWQRVDATAESYEIQYTSDTQIMENPSFFDQVPSAIQSTTVGASSPYAIVSGLDTGKRWFFRVRAVNSSGNSFWSDTVNCLIGTKPEAPTVWAMNASVVRGEEDIKIYWVHNSEDKSTETKAEVHTTTNPLTVEKTFTVTKTDAADISSYTYTPTSISIKSVIFRVRTAGITGEFGDWSEEIVVDILVQPTLGIGLYKSYKWLWDPFRFATDTIYTARGLYGDPYGADMTITQYPIFVVATMYPSDQTPIECNFSIYAEENYQTLDHVGQNVWVNAGDQLFSKTLMYDAQAVQDKQMEKNSFDLAITPGDVILENYTSYRLVITCISNNTLTATGEIIFTLNIEEEELVADAEIGVDTNNIVTYIRPYCTDENGELLSGIRMSVYRIQFDGELIKLDEEVDSASNTMIIDPHPNLNKVRYRIVGFSGKTGTFAFYDLPAYPIGIPEIILQWDEQWNSFERNEDEDEEQNLPANPVISGAMLRLPYNIDTSESNTIDVELVEYIGRDHPVSYYGTQVGQTMSLNCDIDRKDEDTLYTLRRLARYMGDVYVREPNGAGYWAQVGLSFSSAHTEVVVPVSITVNRVEGGV